jgi:hypothetical protein
MMSCASASTHILCALLVSPVAVIQPNVACQQPHGARTRNTAPVPLSKTTATVAWRRTDPGRHALVHADSRLGLGGIAAVR